MDQKSDNAIGRCQFCNKELTNCTLQATGETVQVCVCCGLPDQRIFSRDAGNSLKGQSGCTHIKITKESPSEPTNVPAKPVDPEPDGHWSQAMERPGSDPKPRTTDKH